MRSNSNKKSVYIVTAGMPGAGKGFFQEYVKEKYNFSVVVMGDCVREEAAGICMEMTPKNLAMVATYNRMINREYWAEKTLEKIRNCLERDERRILIDGSRNIEEIWHLGAKLEGSLYITAILASRDARYERFLLRNRNDDVLTREGFEERDLRELNWGSGSVIAIADYFIPNETDDFNDFTKEIDLAIEDILSKQN